MIRSTAGGALFALVVGGCAGEAEAPCEVAAPRPFTSIALFNGPFTQVIGEGDVRLRFETRVDLPSQVALDVGERCARPVPASRQTRARTFRFPDVDGGLGLEHPDLPGTYTLHEAVFTDLEPGVRYPWRIQTGPANEHVVEGSFRAPPTPGTPFRFAFVGDTMAPNKQVVFERMSAVAPDLFLHGGDIQYQTFPGDTWAGYFVSGWEVHRQAPLHTVIGNHEVEGQDELTELYEPLLGGAGRPGGSARWHAVDYGAIRFLMLDSQTNLESVDEPQMVWLEAQLAEVEASTELAYSVLVFHHPVYTLARHPPNERVKALIEPLVRQYNVPLVLTGHNHGYERFVVDGTTWLVDGGGGAFLYDIDESAADYPELVPLRQASSRAYGFTVVDVDENAGLTLFRIDATGAEVDRAVVR